MNTIQRGIVSIAVPILVSGVVFFAATQVNIMSCWGPSEWVPCPLLESDAIFDLEYSLYYWFFAVILTLAVEFWLWRS